MVIALRTHALKYPTTKRTEIDRVTPVDRVSLVDHVSPLDRGEIGVKGSESSRISGLAKGRCGHGQGHLPGADARAFRCEIGMI